MFGAILMFTGFIRATTPMKAENPVAAIKSEDQTAS